MGLKKIISIALLLTFHTAVCQVSAHKQSTSTDVYEIHSNFITRSELFYELSDIESINIPNENDYNRAFYQLNMVSTGIPTEKELLEEISKKEFYKVDYSKLRSNIEWLRNKLLIGLARMEYNVEWVKENFFVDWENMWFFYKRNFGEQIEGAFDITENVELAGYVKREAIKVLAITGASASGKSFLAKELKESLTERYKITSGSNKQNKTKIFRTAIYEIPSYTFSDDEQQYNI